MKESLTNQNRGNHDRLANQVEQRFTPKIFMLKIFSRQTHQHSIHLDPTSIQDCQVLQTLHTGILRNYQNEKNIKYILLGNILYNLNNNKKCYGDR